MASINRGDNTGAFGSEFLRIYLNNPNNLYIQKAIFQINNDLEKEYIDPQFPLRINFTGAETELLHQMNYCKLALWDEHGRRRTADGKFTFFVKENRINAPDSPDEFIEGRPVEEENSIYFNLDEAEFAAQFVINATPSKMSELEMDIDLLTYDNIQAGRNIHTFINEDNKLVIEADVDTTITWDNIEDKPTINGQPLEGDLQINFNQVNSDWNATSGVAQILNKPNLSKVGQTGLYTDLLNLPIIPTKTSELQNDSQFITVKVNNLTNYYNKEEVQDLLQEGTFVEPINKRIDALAEQHQKDVVNLESELTQKVNKNLYDTQMETKADLDYVTAALQDKISTNQLGKGTLKISDKGQLLVSFSANSQTNAAIDLNIPNKVSELQNDLQFVQSSEINLDSYVTKIEYEEDKVDFAHKDEIGSGTFTIKRNNIAVGTFNANSSSNRSVNIEIPEKISQLENDAQFITDDSLESLNTQVSTLQTVISTIPPQITFLQDQIDTKVDKEPGKQLIDSTELQRLSNLQEYDDSEVRQLIDETNQAIETINNNINTKVDKVEGKSLSTNDFTTQDKINLDNLQNNYTVLDTSLQNTAALVQINTTNIDKNSSSIKTLQEELINEQDVRYQKDLDLEAQIAALDAKSDVVDIVANQQELQTYDTSNLNDGDVICVLSDETKDNSMAYYRFDGTTFFFVGSLAASYTKVQTDNLFVPKTLTINGYALSKDLQLTAQDIGALPQDTQIGNGTITIQKNTVSVGTFTLNQEENKAINLEIPEKVSQLENDLGLINDTYLFKYIGAVPEDDNLQDQVDVLRTDIAENATAIDSLKDLITGEIGGLPTVALTGSYTDLNNLPVKISDIKKNNKLNPSSTDYIDDIFISELKEKTGYLTQLDVSFDFAKKSEIPTAISQLENDRGYVTNSAIGRGILTLQINGIEVGTWMANEKDDYTWNIPVDTILSTTSTLPVENKVITTKLESIDNSAVHKEGAESITGDKTFTGVVTLSNTSTAVTADVNDNSTNIATTAYVKTQDYCTNNDAVHKLQDETISGNKTFTGTVSLDDATGITMVQTDNSTHLATTAFVKNQNYAVDSTVVHNTGDETINGDKTFAETITFQGIIQLGQYAHVATPVDQDIPETDDLVTNVQFVNSKFNTLNSNVVHNTENESIQGVKTFVNDIIVSSGNIDLQNSSVNIKANSQDFISKIDDTITLTASQITTTGTISAMSFVGQLQGNAQSATKATQDGNGSIITSTYVPLSTYNSKIQELTNLIDQLNTTISSLQSSVSDLTTRVEALENPSAGE